jgi:alpha-tubulin suppressor-like RCC1 family protein
MLLLNNGDLYAFGDNSEGQCTGNNTRYINPIKIEVDAKDKIIDVYSGYNHNLIVLSK